MHIILGPLAISYEDVLEYLQFKVGSDIMSYD